MFPLRVKNQSRPSNPTRIQEFLLKERLRALPRWLLLARHLVEWRRGAERYGLLRRCSVLARRGAGKKLPPYVTRRDRPRRAPTSSVRASAFRWASPTPAGKLGSLSPCYLTAELSG